MKRVLLVGCPRSGTTLLQSLLATHSDLASFTESQLFGNFSSRRFGITTIKRGLPKRMVAFLKENGLEGKVQPPRVWTGAMPRPFAVRQARKCLALLDDMAAANGKSAWLEKTPRHVYQIPLIELADPSVQFVHIVREPLPVVASLMKVAPNWNVKLAPEAHARRWMKDVRTSIAYKGRERHQFVLYEDLVKSPEAITLRLLERLDFDPSRCRMDAYREVAARLTIPGRWWKSANMEAIASTVSANSAAAPAIEDDNPLFAELAAVYEQARALSFTQMPRKSASSPEHLDRLAVPG